MTETLTISIEDTQIGGVKAFRKLLLYRDGCHLATMYTWRNQKMGLDTKVVQEWGNPNIVFPTCSPLADTEKALLERKLLAVHQAFQSIFFEVEITEVPYPAHTQAGT